ncbi:MAG TPA: DUF190 domain-containing protein [Solirubrobacterales bacterium]|nr:DUF190 domain-containing protein [Solirubrobacterales bacterium]
MLQMRFHFGERDRDGDRPLDTAVMEACERHGVEAAVLLRGVEGFGAKHRLRTERLLSLSEDAPLVAAAVGEAARVEALADEVQGMAREGLVVLEGVDATTGPTTDLAGRAAGPVVGGAEDRVTATVWGARDGAGAPHFEAVAALRRHGAESATVMLGVDGVLGGERRRARFVAHNRGVPALTVAVGERGVIEAALREVDGAHLVTVDSGVGNPLYGRVSHTAATGARATLVTSEIAHGEAHPRYVELIHALRREGAAGATALRGVWGFRGDGEPHGDRMLALRRDVPMVVETVDLAERVERWGALADEVAKDGDVVCSQLVEEIRALS